MNLDRLPAKVAEAIQELCGGQQIAKIEPIQSLWSGYGDILRCRLADHQSVVVKWIRAPAGAGHPRGWNGDRSHARKVRSYEVETTFYERWSEECSASCRVPRCLSHRELGETGRLLILEDLAEAGYPERRGGLSTAERTACIAWLAAFHATFLGREPDDLWPTGTYWHLATRPDELAVLDDADLKAAAADIDARLESCGFKTLVHGDAKLANFCFGPVGVAAVDFQYVGGGVGMKDLAYFLGSCLSESECERLEDTLLNDYFQAFARELARGGSAFDAAAVEAAWRPLYRVAWADFHRFIKGWSPGHWKINSYSERVAREVVSSL